jgi:hypothetical protein
MSVETLLIIAFSFIFIAGIVVFFLLRMPRKLQVALFQHDWNEIQGFCKDKKLWPQAILEADLLLDKALKRRKFKGKQMGERLVSARPSFTNNDTVWSAHNLAKKIRTNQNIRLKENDVKTALVGFRQALRDLGALPNGESRDS